MPIDTKFGEHSYFIYRDLTLESYAKTHNETPTSEVKTKGPTKLFFELIYDTLVYPLPLSCLSLSLASMYIFYGVLDDAPSSSAAS